MFFILILNHISFYSRLSETVKELSQMKKDHAEFIQSWEDKYNDLVMKYSDCDYDKQKAESKLQNAKKKLEKSESKVKTVTKKYKAVKERVKQLKEDLRSKMSRASR